MIPQPGRCVWIDSVAARLSSGSALDLTLIATLSLIVGSIILGIALFRAKRHILAVLQFAVVAWTCSGAISWLDGERRTNPCVLDAPADATMQEAVVQMSLGDPTLRPLIRELARDGFSVRDYDRVNKEVWRRHGEAQRAAGQDLQTPKDPAK